MLLVEYDTIKPDAKGSVFPELYCLKFSFKLANFSWRYAREQQVQFSTRTPALKRGLAGGNVSFRMSVRLFVTRWY